MTRVCLLASRLVKRGGLEKYTSKLASAFVSAGCEVTILTTEPAPIEGALVIEVAKDAKRGFVTFDLRCQEWLRKHPQEIVFGLERTTYQTHYRAGNGVHLAYLKQRALTEGWLKRASFSLNPLHRTLLKLEKKAFEAHSLQLLFANSHMVKEEILSNYSLSPEKVVVVHNGVDWSGVENIFEKANDRFELLFVGHGYRRKGLGFLLRGLAELSNPEIHLSVVGKDKESLSFERLARRLKVNATFYGPQDTLAPFYKKADALAIPSIYDPFANVTVEALAMGVFVVSSKFNGGSEVLTSESGAVIDELTDPASVASAIGAALRRPKTPESARQIRNTIQELDFSHQLDKIVARCIC